MRTYTPPSIPEDELSTLKQWADGGISDARVQWRARLILALAARTPLGQICEALSTTKPTIARWCKRYGRDGLDALLKGKPRGKGGRGVTAEQVTRAITLKDHASPPPPAVRWSIPALAAAVQCSASSLRRAFMERGIQAPHGRPELDRYDPIRQVRIAKGRW